MKIRWKLLLGFGFLIMILMSLGFYSNYLMKKINDQSTVIADHIIPSINVTQSLNTMTSDFRILELEHVIAETPAEMDNIEKQMTDKNNEIQVYFNRFSGMADNAKEQELFNKVKTNWAEYLNIHQQIASLSRQMKTEEAMKLLNGESQKAFNEASNSLLDLAQYSTDDSNEASVYGDQLYAQSLRNEGIIIAISTLLALLIALILIKGITKPINVLNEEFYSLAQNGGDLTQQVKVTSKDEIGQLSSSVNEFIANLRGIIKQVSEVSEQVASSSEELTASAEQQALATEQVTGAIQGVAAGTERQNTAIDETSTAIQQITAAIQEVAASSNEVAGQATQTSTAAKDGQNAIDNAVQQMNKVGKGNAEVQKAVEHLAQGSTKIGEITNVIADIAAQTNLLALNAAIEAARAGEQGRGFAVVAEEVRKLAEQSAKASEQISKLIQENQSSIDNVVSLIETGAQNVNTGIEVVDSAGDMFAKIVDSINQVVNQIQEVSATVEEMASGSQHIVTSIKQIENISKENMAQSETVSAATQEQTASVEQIASASQSLAAMAQDLHATVSKFQV